MIIFLKYAWTIIQCLSKTFQIKHSSSVYRYLNPHETNILLFTGKEAYEVNQCKIANNDHILTVLLLFTLIFFKDPQKYNHPPIYGGHEPSV